MEKKKEYERKYEIIKVLSFISSEVDTKTGEGIDERYPTKVLTEISWFKKEPKLDLRMWDKELTKHGKGLSLTRDEARNLVAALQEFLDSTGDM